MHGSLHLRLLRANRLPKCDHFGLSDPYVMVRVGHVQRQSSVVYCSLDPVWGDEMTFEVDGRMERLELRVYDWNVGVATDKLIGLVEIPLKDVCNRQVEKEKNLKYLHHGNSSSRYASSWVDAEDEMDGGEQLLLLDLRFKNLFQDMLRSQENNQWTPIRSTSIVVGGTSAEFQAVKIDLNDLDGQLQIPLLFELEEIEQKKNKQNIYMVGKVVLSPIQIESLFRSKTSTKLKVRL
ncbi:hypothetical protein GUITHDRAFT_113712 [Guillardia theta CCMP2712]|uniref:C2 domain-containing protein n=1 Tax=Guillardia theta (strain CCMP2712) TaxID=905079 RepID=L1IVF6_GUITC|nr:hypothetical protein GUITHDRAFT_113712 [Guillardia theta CCMP2712]EKX40233.1 hypothetical protein GUITHDRAFT_113712 [Guillardia theta CCMP2712]|eukprot:XP_005827213.1 hypothetical protein GUITHDRAFT_113712 [Guillardia theta CCMP2712]